MSTENEVLDYWFGGSEEQQKFWFGGSDETDRIVKERFGADVERALAGELDSWAITPRGRVALVLLLDQLTRNVFRGTPRAFEGDAKAEKLVVEALDAAMDATLSPFERAFLRMPLMHSEDRLVQKRSVEAFEELVRDAPSDLTKAMTSFRDYAVRHRDIVDRFGRYPHRNKTLGRETTAEETEFLKTPGSSF